MADFLQWITDNQALLVVLIVAVWTVIVTIVRLTPTKKDDEILEKVLPLVERLEPKHLDDLVDFLEKTSGNDEEKEESQPPEEPE